MRCCNRSRTSSRCATMTCADAARTQHGMHNLQLVSDGMRQHTADIIVQRTTGDMPHRSNTPRCVAYHARRRTAEIHCAMQTQRHHCALDSIAPTGPTRCNRDTLQLRHAATARICCGKCNAMRCNPNALRRACDAMRCVGRLKPNSIASLLGDCCAVVRAAPARRRRMCQGCRTARRWVD